MKTLKEILSVIEAPMESMIEHGKKNLLTGIDLLNEIGVYAHESSGKRIRPALMLCSAGIFSKIEDRFCEVASVIEYIHTATLLHDDVVDSAETRRKRKTPNAVWGNEAAVLVGDYLFTVSFKILAGFGNMRVIRALSDCTTMMAKGEILQLVRDYSSADEAEYLEIIEHKTASLMAASMQIGGILGGADEGGVENLRRVGSLMGRAFQIADDALDYSLEKKNIGKGFGSDLKERKITLPLSHALENSAKAEREEIRGVLRKEEISDDDVKKIYECIMKTKSLEYAKNRAKEYTREALEIMAELPTNEYSATIGELIEFIVERDF